MLSKGVGEGYTLQSSTNGLRRPMRAARGSRASSRDVGGPADKRMNLCMSVSIVALKAGLNVLPNDPNA